MSTIIHRSSIFFQSLFQNNDVAYFINGHPHTFTEIKQNKVNRQRRHLENILENGFIIKPCYIWAFYNNTFFYGGWWLYLKCNKIDFAINFKNYDFPKLVPKIMELYPLGFLPLKENFRNWIAEFEKTFHKDSSIRKKNAIAPAWCKYNYRGLIDIKLTKDDYEI